MIPELFIAMGRRNCLDHLGVETLERVIAKRLIIVQTALKGKKEKRFIVVVFRLTSICVSKLKEYGYVATISKSVVATGRSYVKRHIPVRSVMATASGVTLSKKKWVVFYIALLIVSSFLAWYVFARPETYRDVSERVYESIVRNDARSLLRYVLEEEANAVHLTREKLDRLLELVNSRLEGFELVDKTYDFWEEGNNLLVIYKYHHKDGRTASLGYGVVLTDEGIKVDGLTRVLASAVANTYFEPGIVKPTGMILYEQFSKSIQKAMPLFKSTGLVGIAKRQPLTGSFTLLTWEEWKNEYEERVREAKAKNPQ